VGILSDTRPDVINNVIYSVSGGQGGDAGNGGAAGDGGNGGDGGLNVLPTDYPGAGGDGGNGGDAGNGGAAGDGIAIHADGSGAAPRIVNNTVDRLHRGDFGWPGSPGNGGSGGLAAPGGVNGDPGTYGIGGLAGADGKTVGLYLTNGASAYVYNNILVRTEYIAPPSYYVGTYTNSYGVFFDSSAGRGPEVVTLDYNNVWNWHVNYVNVSPGSNDISADPMFVDIFCSPDCEDYGLVDGSPCIDTASNDWAPLNDRDGKCRPQDGDLDGTYVADRGAYEFLTGTVTFTIPCDAIGAYTTPDGHLELAWPSGICPVTCTSVITMNYQPLGGLSYGTGPLTFGGIGFELAGTDCEGKPLTGFETPISFTIHYVDELLPPRMDEASLALYYWTGLMWEDAIYSCVPPTTYTRDLDLNVLTVPICHLSEWGMMGLRKPVEVYLPLVLKAWP
jgi:hypothetical protein